MNRKAIARVLIAFLLFGMGYLVSDSISIFVIISAYLVAGAEVIVTAGRNILYGQVFDENFLMTLASLGAIALGEYEEAAAVMIFYQIGECFENYAVGKSRKSIADLMDIYPEKAVVLRDGEEMTVDPEDVKTGEVIVIRPGERIPLDGMVTFGSTSIDTSSLTGESIPEDVTKGDHVISGCINMTGLIQVCVTNEFADSTVSRIIELVEDAASRKAPVENFITKFASIYTPAVVTGAILLALLPPFLLGSEFSTWIYRACLFLVVSCPCALVISVPMSFFSGIGTASSRGILVKGSSYLEALAGIDTIMFDKTGTLTTGRFRIEEVSSGQEDILQIAASLEKYSNHPIAKCICENYDGETIDVSDIEELPGRGICGLIDGETVFAGNSILMKSLSIDVKDESTVVHIATESEYIGYIRVRDTLKDNTAKTIDELRMYCSRIVMITGDNIHSAESTAREARLKEVYAGLMPSDKVSIAERIIGEADGKCAFVGDGVNDAPVIARADVGIAMGGLGSEAAMEAADIIIMDDDISKIPLGIRIGKKTVRLCKENIWFAIGVKLIVLILGALGLVNMWAAVFADVGVAVICIMNAMRALSVK